MMRSTFCDMPRKKKEIPCVKSKPAEKVATGDSPGAAEKLLSFVLEQIRKDCLTTLQRMTDQQRQAFLQGRDTEAVIGEVTNVLSFWMPTSEPSLGTPTEAKKGYPLLQAETDFLKGVNKVMIEVLKDHGPLPYSVLAGWFYLVANKYSSIHAMAYPFLCQSKVTK